MVPDRHFVENSQSQLLVRNPSDIAAIKAVPLSSARCLHLCDSRERRERSPDAKALSLLLSADSLAAPHTGSVSNGFGR
jgi:hypothetical protein